MKDLVSFHQCGAVMRLLYSSLLRLMKHSKDADQLFKLLLLGDLQRAFPSVVRSKLFSYLAKIGISSRMLNAIEDIHSSNNSQVRFNGYLSKSISINKGVREVGGSFSYFIFVIFQ